MFSVAETVELLTTCKIAACWIDQPGPKHHIEMQVLLGCHIHSVQPGRACACIGKGKEVAVLYIVPSSARTIALAEDEPCSSGAEGRGMRVLSKISDLLSIIFLIFARYGAAGCVVM